MAIISQEMTGVVKGFAKLKAFENLQLYAYRAQKIM